MCVIKAVPHNVCKSAQASRDTFVKPTTFSSHIFRKAVSVNESMRQQEMNNNFVFNMKSM